MTTRENIVLIGFMGSGKSSIGRIVSKSIGFQFVDTDQLIVNRAGIEISDIFAGYGEEHFRLMETDAIASLAHLNRCVIATGGGIVVKKHNHILLRDLGFVVCLTASEDILFERVSRTNKRPLLHTENPRAALHDLFTARADLYAAAAHLTIDTSALSHEESAEKVISAARSALGWNKEP